MARRILAVALVIALGQVDLALAQTGVAAGPGKIQESVGREAARQMLVNNAILAHRSVGFGATPDAPASAASQLMGPFIGRHGSFRQQVFATIGAIAGMAGGGYLGVKIEGDRCHCDDPGLAGFVIGAPIGAIVGGVVGFKLGK
jgi:hypothetical protein